MPSRGELDLTEADETYAGGDVKRWNLPDGARRTKIEYKGKVFVVTRNTQAIRRVLGPQVWGLILRTTGDSINSAIQVLQPLLSTERFILSQGGKVVGLAHGEDFDLAIARDLGVADDRLDLVTDEVEPRVIEFLSPAALGRG